MPLWRGGARRDPRLPLGGHSSAWKEGVGGCRPPGPAGEDAPGGRQPPEAARGPSPAPSGSVAAETP
eukprot:11175405-Lingulodinium_polyedra.AAC.1